MGVSVQVETFDISLEQNKLIGGRTDIGAVVSFTGLVRDFSHGRSLNMMTLEHYEGMAEAELENLLQKAKKRWNLQAARIIHRYGDLNPGDLIVLVLAASPHREDAFQAAEFMMDYLKTSAPFWKKEHFLDGDGSTWVEAKVEDDKRVERW